MTSHTPPEQGPARAEYVEGTLPRLYTVTLFGIQHRKLTESLEAAESITRSVNQCISSWQKGQHNGCVPRELVDELSETWEAGGLNRTDPLLKCILKIESWLREHKEVKK